MGSSHYRPKALPVDGARESCNASSCWKRALFTQTLLRILSSAERFIPEMVLRSCMERGSCVVVASDGTRFLGRFPFHSQTQAEKFVGSATRQGFRAEVEGESETTAPPP